VVRGLAGRLRGKTGTAMSRVFLFFALVTPHVMDGRAGHLWPGGSTPEQLPSLLGVSFLQIIPMVSLICLEPAGLFFLPFHEGL